MELSNGLSSALMSFASGALLAGTGWTPINLAMLPLLSLLPLLPLLACAAWLLSTSGRTRAALL